MGLSTDVRILSQLELYMKEIELFNPAYGLVKVKDHRELLVKHILDSLAPVNTIRQLLGKPGKGRVADIGSGAGLPGIPLAISMGTVEFSLIERMTRRAGFLRDAIAVLSLSNVVVLETEMEKPALVPEGSFDVVVFRAFKPLLPALLKKLLALLAPGGVLAAYKGRRQVIDEEMGKLFGTSIELKAGGDIQCQNFAWEKIHWEIIPLKVPFLEEERNLVLIWKP